MSREEFKKFIESIGFKYSHYAYYDYKKYRIDLSFIEEYGFYNGSKWKNYEYNDLTPLEEYFKNELRSFKIKNILG